MLTDIPQSSTATTSALKDINKQKMSASFASYFDFLSTALFQESQIITYKYVCSNFNLPSNLSKQLLFAFVQNLNESDDEKSKFNVTYAIGGHKSESQNFSVKLVNDTDIEKKIQNDYAKVKFVHVYSIQPTVIKDFSILNEVQKSSGDETCQKWSSIKSTKPIIKKKAEVPKPTSASSKPMIPKSKSSTTTEATKNSTSTTTASITENKKASNPFAASAFSKSKNSIAASKPSAFFGANKTKPASKTGKPTQSKLVVQKRPTAASTNNNNTNNTARKNNNPEDNRKTTDATNSTKTRETEKESIIEVEEEEEEEEEEETNLDAPAAENVRNALLSLGDDEESDEEEEERKNENKRKETEEIERKRKSSTVSKAAKQSKSDNEDVIEDISDAEEEEEVVVVGTKNKIDNANAEVEKESELEPITIEDEDKNEEEKEATAQNQIDQADNSQNLEKSKEVENKSDAPAVHTQTRRVRAGKKEITKTFMEDGYLVTKKVIVDDEDYVPPEPAKPKPKPNTNNKPKAPAPKAKGGVKKKPSKNQGKGSQRSLSSFFGKPK